MIIRYLDPKGLGLGNCRAEKAECRGINRYSQFSLRIPYYCVSTTHTYQIFLGVRSRRGVLRVFLNLKP